MSNNGLHKKYGLFTAICMVVGIVIGSGVFFKAEKILNETGGNLPLGILAWCVGAAIMVACAYAFSLLATRYERVNGIVDYSEAIVGKNYAYYVGWFLATMYYPSMTSVLAWVSSRYLCVLLGFSVTGAECLTIAGFFLIASYVLNTISPILAGKFQVSTTVIKMVPLALMAVVGIIVGLVNGMTVENFTTVVDPSKNPGMALFTAVVATAFAFEGWIIATSINAELKDAKKNLPRALVIGTLIVAATYILYYIGLSGTVTNAVLMESGEAGVRVAFETLFSRVGGTVLSVLVVISCLGTLNGLMLGTSRGMYAIAVRGRGPAPKVFSQVDPTTDMPTNSAVLGLFFCAFWLLYFYGSQLTSGWFGFFRFDSSELPIITIYAAYLPIFFIAMKKEQSLSKLQRFGAFPLAALGSIFMVVAAIFAHSATVVSYLVAFVIFMVIGFFFRKEQKI
ncbi:MAG: APC family permease [Clostridia bacterium]|nr:APC family permease [Clostridia bacterium]